MAEYESQYSGLGGTENEFTYDSMTSSSLTAADTTLIVIYALITAIGLLANGVVLFVLVAGNEIGKTVTTIFILQLTLADTTFLFTLPVFSMQKVLGSWAFGSGLCTICQTVKFFNYYAGIFFLTVMSVDRYVAVAYSTKSLKIRTRRRTYILSTCVWICAGLMSFPILLFAKTDETPWDKSNVFCKLLFPGYKPTEIKSISIPNYGNGSELIEYVFDNEIGTAYNNSMDRYDGDYYNTYYNDVEDELESSEQQKFECNHKNQPTSYRSWLVINFVVAFVLPFIVIVVSYVKIIRHLQTSEQRAVHTASNRSAKMRRKVTRMVAALVIGFATCWLPHHLYNIARIAGFSASVNACYGIDQFLVALAFSNSAINPILYSFLGNSFSQRLQTATASISRKLSTRRRSSQPPNMNSATESGVAKRILAKQRRESRVLVKNQNFELKTFKGGGKCLQSHTKLTDV